MAGFYARTDTLSRSLTDGLLRLMRPWPHGTPGDIAGPVLLSNGADAPLLVVNLVAEVLSQEIAPIQPTAGPYGQLLELGGRVVSRRKPPGCPDCDLSVPRSCRSGHATDTRLGVTERWLVYLSALAMIENAFLWGGGHRPLTRRGGTPIRWLDSTASGDALIAGLREARWRPTRNGDSGPGNRLLEVGRFILAAREALGAGRDEDRSLLARVLETYSRNEDDFGSPGGAIRKGLEDSRLHGARVMLDSIVERARGHEAAEIDLMRIVRLLGLDEEPSNGGGGGGSGGRRPIDTHLLGAFAAYELFEDLADRSPRDAAETERRARAYGIDAAREAVLRGVDPAEFGAILSATFRRMTPATPALEGLGRGLARRSSRSRAASRTIAAAAALAAGAAVVYVAVTPRHPPVEDPIQVVRLKGQGAGLFVQRGDARFAFGDRPIVAGDVLAVRSDSGRRFALLLGLEASGRRRVYLSDGAGQSVTLDPEAPWLSTGIRVGAERERLFAIFSDRKISADEAWTELDEPGWPSTIQGVVQSWSIEPALP